MKDNATPLYTSPQLGAKVSTYAEQHSTPLPKYISDYHARISSTRDDSEYLSSGFQSQFNIFLAKSIGAKRGEFSSSAAGEIGIRQGFFFSFPLTNGAVEQVLEIGVYAGFSALVWAHAVGPDGQVTGLEYEPEYAKLSNDGFAANGVNNVEIVVGPASET